MAKIDITDPSVLMNPSSYSGLRDEKRLRSTHRKEKTEFSGFFNDLLGKTADALGPVQNLPVSDESVNILMDQVRDAGDKLKDRPLAEEIMRYKLAVRNFINYIVENCYSLEYDEGIQNKFKPGFKGRRGTPEADRSYGYSIIQVIDKKLEDLGAMLLTNQMRQLELVSRLEEIKGLLIDLLL
jgi:uncharacterized protein YaaR (DUF327 family)